MSEPTTIPSFNPSNNEHVAKIKAMTDELTFTLLDKKG